MNIFSSVRRCPTNFSLSPGRSLAFGLVFILSGCVQIVLLIATVSIAEAMPAQGPPSNDRFPETGDNRPTRPRTVEPRAGKLQYTSRNGPTIRVALMTDVASVALSSASALHVKRGSGDGEKTINEPLHIEVRKVMNSPAPGSHTPADYRVSVGASLEPRQARKLADELKKKFFEPVTLTFDEKRNEYAVLIGQFSSRTDATRLVERLRTGGYDELRIVTGSMPADSRDDLMRDRVTDTNARAAKYKAQPSYASSDRATVSATLRPSQVAAIASNKLTVSSGDKLIVSAASFNASAGDEDKTNPAGRQNEQTDSRTAIPAAPPSVRIGDRNYRGEIHLILNPRGRIDVVNALPLEEYLRGVVPMELSPGQYPEGEALKAQAVAARSYALAHLHRDRDYDLVDDTRAQVYGGLSAERELSDRAVEETRGIVAAYTNEDGRLEPIEALYTANCGGRTENNEEVFGGKPVAYLRGVACSPDRQTLEGRDILSNRDIEPLSGIDGRSIAREVALLSVLGFSLPRRVTSSYLRGSSDQDELRAWIEQTGRLAGREKSGLTRGNITRLGDFVHALAAATYGEGRAATLLTPGDVDYILTGIRVQGLAARAELAMLMRDGILRLPAEVILDGRSTLTRARTIETIARAMTEKLQSLSSNSAASDSNSHISTLQSPVHLLTSQVASAARNGRLILGSDKNEVGSRVGSRFTTVNTSASKPARAQKQQPATNKSSGVASQTARTATTEAPMSGSRTATSEKSSSKASVSSKEPSGSQTMRANPPRRSEPEGIAIAERAWLFRAVGGESYAVDRLALIGGERVTYHLNAGGQADFLEASISELGASSDRFSSIAQWQERVSVEDLQKRLAGARINVGRITDIDNVAFSSSSRVTEVEITGDKGHARLRRPQIRSALGLKEYLFVVDRETDDAGRVVAFVFTGRGWGHGVGMCQTGAFGLAREGYSYSAILQKYYTGATLQKMY